MKKILYAVFIKPVEGVILLLADLPKALLMVGIELADLAEKARNGSKKLNATKQNEVQ